MLFSPTVHTIFSSNHVAGHKGPAQRMVSQSHYKSLQTNASLMRDFSIGAYSNLLIPPHSTRWFSKLHRLRSSQYTETCYISFNQQVCSLQKLQQWHKNPILNTFAPLKVSLVLPLIRSTWCFNTDYQTQSVNPRLAWSWVGKSWQEELFYSIY